MYRIPQALYENLKQYLQKLEDEEAKILLFNLENLARPACKTPGGSYILDYNQGSQYRVD